MVFVIALLLIIYLLHIPVVNTFRTYDFYNGLDVSPWIRDSVGSMGFSDSQCSLHNMVKGTTSILTCKAGHISKFVAYGVHTDNEDQRYCLRKKFSDCD